MKEVKDNAAIRAYLSSIGRRGGRKSRRMLTPEQARDMVRIREAKRAFRLYYAQCFWYMEPEIKITKAELAFIARGLRTYGGHEGYRLADTICP
jgi:hypothetical protein